MIPAAAPGPDRGRRPNVVVIVSDQQTSDTLSHLGNPHVWTPALDALAAEGVVFGRAYCTQPLCAPARASLWTGRMPSELGVSLNGGAIPDPFAADQLGRLFARAGYDCGYAGKWHLPGEAVDGVSGFRLVHGFGDDGLVEACAGFLSEDRAAPFLLVAAINEPHGICEWARGQSPPSGPVADVAPEHRPPLPPNFARPSYEAALPRLARERMPHAHPTDGWDEDDWRSYRHAYYRLCERVDAQVGGIVDALEANGLRDDTLIVFTSDHGDGVGAHQWNQKWVLTEESVRVPFVVAPPRRPAVHIGRVDDRLVSVGLDLLPTLCDYAGVAAPAGLLGHSVKPAVEGEAGVDAGADRRDHLVCETVWGAPGFLDAIGRLVVTRDRTYACYSWGSNREQLFDLATDPGQLNNLAAYLPYRGDLERLRGLLAAHCATIGDSFTRVIPNHEGVR